MSSNLNIVTKSNCRLNLNEHIRIIKSLIDNPIKFGTQNLQNRRDLQKGNEFLQQAQIF